MSLRPAILIYNPKSGRHGAGGLVPKLVEQLRVSGYDATPEATRAPGDATEIARRHAVRGDIEVAFAVGGDGTLREVAKGLLDSDVVLGPLPSGTANVLSISLGLPRRALAAAKAMHEAEPRPIDVGLAGAEPFLMMVSAGLEAAVMKAPNPTLKRWLGPVGIGISGVAELLRYRFPVCRIRVDDDEIETPFFSACNIALFGGPFAIAPEADHRDGRLDLVTFRRPGRWPTFRFALGVLTGRHLRDPDVSVGPFEALEILGPLPYGLQMDGDVLPLAPPIRITVDSGRLRVMSRR
ncbi:MAG: diacylglycerol kinase family protein [Acidobacteriota bacterium]